MSFGLVFNPEITPFHGIYFEFLLAIRQFDFKLQTAVTIYAAKLKGDFLEVRIFKALVIPGCYFLHLCILWYVGLLW